MTSEVAVKPFPATLEELRLTVAEIMSELLKNPANALIIGELVLGEAARSMRYTRERALRNMQTPALVQTEYPNSARATVSQPGEGGLLSVTVERRVTDDAGKPTGDWSTEVVSEGFREAISKLVLSTTAVPGTVYFVTTEAEVEAYQESLADMYQAELAAQAQPAPASVQ